MNEENNNRSSSRILRLPEVEHRTGYKKSAIYQKMKTGDFPKVKRIGPRAVGWDEADIDFWIDQRLQGNFEETRA